jgi:hypothetical protein
MTLVLRTVAARGSYRLPRIAFNSWPAVPLPLERIFIRFLGSGILFLFFIGPRRCWTVVLRISGHSQKRNYHGGDGESFHGHGHIPTGWPQNVAVNNRESQSTPWPASPNR